MAPSDLDALFVLDAIEVRALGEEGEPQRRLIAVPRLNPSEPNVSYVCVCVCARARVCEESAPVGDRVLVLLPVPLEEEELQVVHAVAQRRHICDFLLVRPFSSAVTAHARTLTIERPGHRHLFEDHLQVADHSLAPGDGPPAHPINLADGDECALGVSSSHACRVRGVVAHVPRTGGWR